ncbi:MAG TPA: oligosaccharide flippase family protein [Terriglobales bacterium]|nr:oligosaccharide flippase family protein [Terriglobales bacterium]
MSADAATLQAIGPIQSRRFALNLVANVGNLGLSVVVGILYVPFLVRHLGPAVYGLIPLISMVTSYMALITYGLDSAVARFLTIALERKDHENANLIFNVSLWGNLALGALLVIPAAFAIAHVDHILRIPPGYEASTRWLFGGAVAAFLLNQVKTPFGISSFCRNRLDLQNLVAAFETLTRVGLVVCLFCLFTPRIEYIGGAILAGTIVSTIGMVWLWKVLTPSLRISLGKFDWSMFGNLCGTGGWVIISQLGVMLYLNIDLLLANRLFGPEQAGRYAAVLALPTLLRSLAIAVGGIFAPTMYHIYARGDIDGLVVYLNRAIKFLGLVMALSIGLICGFSEPLLRLWLGPGFSNLAPLLFLMAIHLCINLSMYPLYAVPLAANRVKVPGLVTLAIGVGNLLLALLLAGVFGWGLNGLAAAGAIMLTVRHLLFTPLYGARVLNRSYGTFFRGLFPIVLATLATIGLCRLILSRWAISSWVELGMSALGVSLLFVAIVCLLLAPAERLALRDAVVGTHKKA